MATIGELIQSLKGYGPDADPIRPEDSDGDGTIQRGSDDIPTSVKEKVGEYLHQRTGGTSTDNPLENINHWPVEDTGGVSDYSLTDANGKPVGPTKTATGEDSYGYTKSLEDALNAAITVFESEGHFFGGGIDEDNPVSDLIDKSSQADGHDILNRFAGAPFAETTGRTHESMPDATKSVLEEAHPASATSSALRNNRWSRGYYPENDTNFGLQNANTPMFQELAGKIKNTRRRYTPDRPFVESKWINKDYSEEMTKKSGPWPETDPLLASFGDEPFSEPWHSFAYDDVEGKMGYLSKLMDKMRDLNVHHPDWYYEGKQSFVAAFIVQLVLEVVGIIVIGLTELFTKPDTKADEDGEKGDEPSAPWDLAYGSSFKRKKNNAAPPPQDPPGLLGSLLDALPGLGEEISFEGFMAFLEIPMPRNAMKALQGEDGFWGLFIGNTFKWMGQMVGNEADMVVFWGPILRQFSVLLTDVDKLFPMPKIGDANEIIPGAAFLFAIDAFMNALKNSSVTRLIRVIVSLGDVMFATAAVDSPNDFVAGTDYRGNWDIHPKFRGFRSRTRVPTNVGSEDAGGGYTWKIAQSIEELPSMYLLPASFQNSYLRFDDATGAGNEYSSLPTALHPNKLINAQLHKKATAAGGEIGGVEGSAIDHKIGTPIDGGKRFSPTEVNFMEGLLEAEYMPFYFQDLRTNEIIAFHAFLSSLSDSFSPSYSASSGFGRIEDVQVYQKTSRSISVTFTLAAMQKADMNEMYVKLNKLVTMVYPQWSRGTALSTEINDLVPAFIQPFSQIPTATPVVRLRIGDIIQSNYSKFNLTRLFGTGWTEEGGGFGVGDNPDGALKGAAQSLAYDHCAKLPISDNQGTALNDSSVGFPIGSEVNVRAPSRKCYYRSQGTLETPSFKAIIKRYITAIGHANDGKEQGNQDVILEVEADYTLRRTMKEGENGWVENRSYPPHNNVKIPYSWLTRDTSAFQRSVTNPTTWPMVVDKATDVKAKIDEYEKSGDTKPDGDPAGVAKALFAADNPMFQAFESSMGRGLAGVITSLDVGYKLNDAPWEIDPGMRGPTMLEISVGFTPIHDIAPGIDSDGYNRAPVYKMASSGEIAGDAWDGQADNGYGSFAEHAKQAEDYLLEAKASNNDKKE